MTGTYLVDLEYEKDYREKITLSNKCEKIGVLREEINIEIVYSIQYHRQKFNYKGWYYCGKDIMAFIPEVQRCYHFLVPAALSQ